MITRSKGVLKMILTGKLEAEMKLVKRHIDVLTKVMRNQPIGIIKLAQMMELPEHKIRYSLRILEQENLIEPSPEGAKPTKRAKKEIKNIKNSLEKIIEDANEMIAQIEEMEKM